MLKKVLSAFAVASIMVAASCSNYGLDSVKDSNESLVTFTAQLPGGLQTRSFGDGTTATTLDYSVYEVKDNSWTLLKDLGETGVAIKSLTAEVSLRLVNGNTYGIIFWADAENSIYTFDAEGRKVTADYTNAPSNTEAFDAFYAVSTIKVDGNLSETVELRRPFAQLNIGAADLEAAKKGGHEVKKAGVKVMAYNTLNFSDETVSGEAEVTFSPEALPAEEFPVKGYDYLTMNYLLMPKDKEVKDVTINYDNAESRTFTNVPLQRNYRTNIYGNLLTSGNDFTVVIKPGFEEPDYEVEVVEAWDGKTTIKPTPDADGVYHIKTAAEFVGMLNDSRPYPEGNKYKNVVLDSDIDLGGHEIYGFGDGSGFFYGVFDGQNHTVKNFVINHSTSNGIGTGLFNYNANYDGGATIKNLKVTGANVTGPKSVGVIAGAAYQGFTIDNCHVSESVVYATEKRAGGIVGFNDHSLVKNCSVENTKIYTKSNGLITENKNCEISGYNNNGGKEENNTSSNVTIERNYQP